MFAWAQVSPPLVSGLYLIGSMSREREALSLCVGPRVTEAPTETSC